MTDDDERRCSVSNNVAGVHKQNSLPFNVFFNTLRTDIRAVGLCNFARGFHALNFVFPLSFCLLLFARQ